MNQGMFFTGGAIACSRIILEGPVGLEPTTPCLKGRCSNQLSYGPITLIKVTTLQRYLSMFSFLIVTSGGMDAQYVKQRENNTACNDVDAVPINQLK